MAGTEEILVEANTERWEVDDDYDGYARTKYIAECCPCEDECSKNAWSHGSCWSYEGPHKVRNYVCRHLVISSKHYKSTEDAKLLCQYTTIREEVETFADRESYRKGLAAAAAQKRSSVSATPGRVPSTPPQGHEVRREERREERRERSRSRRRRDRGDDGGVSADVRELTRAVGDLVTTMVRPPAPSTASSSAAPSQVPNMPQALPGGVITVPNQNVMVPAHSLRLLAASLSEIRHSVEKLTVILPVITSAQQAMESLASGGAGRGREQDDHRRLNRARGPTPPAHRDCRGSGGRQAYPPPPIETVGGQGDGSPVSVSVVTFVSLGNRMQ